MTAFAYWRTSWRNAPKTRIQPKKIFQKRFLLWSWEKLVGGNFLRHNGRNAPESTKQKKTSPAARGCPVPAIRATVIPATAKNPKTTRFFLIDNSLFGANCYGPQQIHQPNDAKLTDVQEMKQYSQNSDARSSQERLPRLWPGWKCVHKNHPQEQTYQGRDPSAAVRIRPEEFAAGHKDHEGFQRFNGPRVLNPRRFASNRVLLHTFANFLRA